MPLPRSLPGSTPFPDPPPDRTHSTPSSPRTPLPPGPRPGQGCSDHRCHLRPRHPARHSPRPLCRFVWVSALPRAPGVAPGQAHGHRGGPGCRTSGESAQPANRRAQCPAALSSQDPAEAPELTGTSWAAATPTGRTQVAAGPRRQGLSPTCRSEMPLPTHTWTSVGPGDTLRPQGRASGGLWSGLASHVPRPRSRSTSANKAREGASRQGGPAPGGPRRRSVGGESLGALPSETSGTPEPHAPKVTRA